MNVDKLRFDHTLKEKVLIDPVPQLNLSPKTYIAVSSNTGLVKIGRSTHYEDRIRAIEAKAKDVLLVVAVFNDDREMKLHRRFDGQRIVGEWFKLSMVDIEQLRKEAHIQ